jgi:hypothetical protein
MISSDFDIPLPAGAGLAGRQLRIGLYQPATGEQLAVSSIQAGSAASNGGTYALLPLGDAH